MKKVLLVLALVVAYGVSMSTASAKVVTIDDAKVTVVADVADDNKVAPEGEKEKTKAKEAKATKSGAKSEGCATAKSEGCATAKAEGKSSGCATAKSEGCGDKTKTASNDKK
jgi:flagellar biosynthesis/type III secretory pathway protein FliH